MAPERSSSEYVQNVDATDNFKLSEAEGTELVLQIHEVNKRFGGLQALSLVSFNIRHGHLKALIGPNGAGKSTLLNVVSRLYAPDSGQVSYYDQNLLSYPANKIAGLGIGRTFQMVQFLGNMKVIESVMVGAHSITKNGMLAGILKPPSERREEKEIKDRAFEALTTVDRESLSDRPISSLTYADQKRVELARALIGRPKLLLLDEPAGGLTPAEAEELGRLLRSIRNSGPTILIIEHNMPLVMSIADDIVVLNYGQVIAEGKPAEIASNAAVIEAYLGEES